MGIGSLPPGVTKGLDEKIFLGFAAKYELLIICLMFFSKAIEFLFINGSLKEITHFCGLK